MSTHSADKFSERTLTAYAHVSIIFEGMKDKTGLHFADHSFRVARSAASFARTDKERESLYIVGIYHDVLEDSSLTPEDLAEVGLSEEEIAAVVALSDKRNGGKRIHKTYDDFLSTTIYAGFLATVTKLADVMDNLTRPRHKTFKTAQKLAALSRLSSAASKYFRRSDA